MTREELKRRGQLSKEEIEAVANVGDFIYPDGYRELADLDATHAREFLESKGFNVVKNYDAETNGWAITDDGIMLSTNGFITRRRDNNGI